MSQATILVCIALALASSGCGGGWQIEQLTPVQVMERKRPERVRVQLADKSSIQLNRPSIVGDSLYGVQPGGVRRAVALSAVTRVDTPGYNSAPILVGVLLALGIAIVIANGGQVLSY